MASAAALIESRVAGAAVATREFTEPLLRYECNTLTDDACRQDGLLGGASLRLEAPSLASARGRRPEQKTPYGVDDLVDAGRGGDGYHTR